MQSIIVRSKDGEGSWEPAQRPWSASLAPYVHRVEGYSEQVEHPARRIVLPSSKVIVALSLGPAIVAAQRDDGRPLRAHPVGLVAGFDDAVGITEHAGFDMGIRLDLTPIGAQKLFGVPASELAGRIVDLGDVLPRACNGLIERLRDLPHWNARFEALELALVRAMRPSTVERDAMAWAVAQLDESGGRLSIEALVARLGYSHKHVLRMFQRHVGTTPKLYAQLVRFERAVEAMRSQPITRLAELAQDTGYSDQAHLVREFRRLSGDTPSRLATNIRE
jgi:AraC-like DNA-binding protein